MPDIQRRGLMLVLSPRARGRRRFPAAFWRWTIPQCPFPPAAPAARTKSSPRITFVRRPFGRRVTDNELPQTRAGLRPQLPARRARLWRNAGQRARRSVRHRMAGHAAIGGKGAGRSLAGVFILPRHGRAGAQASKTRAAGRRGRNSAAHGQGHRRDEPLNWRIRLRCRQSRF